MTKAAYTRAGLDLWLGLCLACMMAEWRWLELEAKSLHLDQE